MSREGDDETSAGIECVWYGEQPVITGFELNSHVLACVQMCVYTHDTHVLQGFRLSEVSAFGIWT